jgi:hypothetical protein
MAKKLRKMLGDVNALSTVALMRLIDTQSKATICNWCIGYAEAHVLPIFEKHSPNDDRPRNALNAAREYLDGKSYSSPLRANPRLVGLLHRLSSEMFLCFKDVIR